MSPLPLPGSSTIEMQTVPVALAMVIFGEARGCTEAGRIAQACSVRNRVNLDSAEFGKGWRAVIGRPFAYSCFNASDANREKIFQPLRTETAAVWDACYEIAEAVLAGVPDPTGGAIFYFSKPVKEAPKVWGPVEQTLTVDGLQFYRRAKAWPLPQVQQA